MEKGIYVVFMLVIVIVVKIGMGIIYNYFENKEVLINVIYVDIK